jgi:hypothetical protein
MVNDDIRFMIDKIKNFDKFLFENKFIDNALDKIKSVGGFNNLPDIDKLALLTDCGDEEQLKRLDLRRIFSENGGTFGRLMIKIKVKDINNQPIKHRFSEEFAGKEGWLYPYINYNEDNKPYVKVRFNEFIPDQDMKGGGTYEERPIMLHNMYPIGYNEINSEFTDYDKKIDFDRSEFLDSIRGLMDDEDL